MLYSGCLNVHTYVFLVGLIFLYTVPRVDTGVVSLLWFYFHYEYLLMRSLCVYIHTVCSFIGVGRWGVRVWKVVLGGGFLCVCFDYNVNIGLSISVNVSFICKSFLVISHI
jgi:hypothetical protein